MSSSVSEVVTPSEQQQDRKASGPPAEEKTEPCGGAGPEGTADPEQEFPSSPEDDTDESSESDTGDCNDSFHIQERLFSCSVCGRNFGLKGNMKKHMLLHSGVKPFSCPRCAQTFAQKGNMIRHMKTCSCSNYGQQSPNAADVKGCMSAHSGTKPLGQRFSGKATLKTHMSVHTREKLFGCTMCGHRFTRKVNLTKHMKVHPNKSDLDVIK